MADPNGPAIEAMRKKRGWKRSELARRVGLKYSGLYNIEKKFKGAAEETLQRIANEFGVGLDEVMNEPKTPRKAPTEGPKPSSPAPPPRPTKSPTRVAEDAA